MTPIEMITGQKPRISITFHLNLTRDKNNICINKKFCKDLSPHSHHDNECQKENFRKHIPN